MGLDIRTIMVMIAMMTLMFGVLLELAGLHAGNIRGVRQWAVANLCFSLGLSLAYFYTLPSVGHGWAVVAGATLVGMGIGLQFTGIQAFKETRNYWPVVVLMVGLVFIMNLWFAVIRPDVAARAIANSLVFAIGYAACARALLIRIEPPLRTAYWFTGLCFALLVLVMLARAAMIWISPPGSYWLYADMPVNPTSFFIACIVLLCVTFGFVLMLNYRLFMDIQKLASRDVLTGAFNRRRLQEEAVRQRARWLRTGEPLSIMMIDVDHFKSINDRYGHPIGDEVLRRLVAIAQTSIRPDDHLARYGGEEFCILLPSTTEQAALNVAERLRAHYEAMTIDLADQILNSTISIGVADSTHAGFEFTSLVAAADAALYRAKQQGRNRVVAYSSMHLPHGPAAVDSGLAASMLAG
jgi:diguanylate cyclase (GGDEF)-like protein